MLLCQLMNDAKEVEVNYSSLKPIGKVVAVEGLD